MPLRIRLAAVFALGTLLVLAGLGALFYVHTARTRAQGGTGLGLAIVAAIATAHGGQASAANHPENGAVVTLTLRVHQLGEAARPGRGLFQDR
ncbi:ATP-binding protein, partial [Protofrankia coriariae]